MDWPPRLLPLRDPPFAPSPPSVDLLPTRDARPFGDILTGKDLPWTVSTHVFPAAWPRTRLRGVQGRPARFEPVNPTGQGKEGAAKGARWLIDYQEHAGFIDPQAPATYEDQDQLWIAVNRYAPVKPRRNGYTLIFSHASGLHKESCEGALATLLASDAADLIDEAWSFDCANHGDSSLINRDKLGDTFYWPDAARDIANFILRYLPDAASRTPMTDNAPPRVLRAQPVPDPSLLQLDMHRSSPLNTANTGETASGPVRWRGRRIIGTGHSLGGGCTNFVASSLPQLFHGLIYVDPILPPKSQGMRNKVPIVTGALYRRDRWASRDDALTSFLTKRDFFARWHPALLRRYVDHNLHQPHPDQSEEVELKTRKIDEARVFADTRANSGEEGAGARVVYLPAWLAARTTFIFADHGLSVYPDAALEEMVGNAKGSRGTKIKDGGHLLMQEKPAEVAAVMASSLIALAREDARAKL